MSLEVLILIVDTFLGEGGLLLRKQYYYQYLNELNKCRMKRPYVRLPDFGLYCTVGYYSQVKKFNFFLLVLLPTKLFFPGAKAYCATCITHPTGFPTQRVKL